MLERPLLFDATRLIWRSWARRYSTGIDRVCDAYLDRFAARSQAVVQHRGVARILAATHSDELFDALRGPNAHVRRRIAALAPRAVAAGRSVVDTGGAIYLNVGHTDFDLAAHGLWTERCRLRPVYLVHDLIPLRHPDLSRPHAIARHRGRVIGALQRAAGIIVNSEATAAELERFARRQRMATPPVLPAPLGFSALTPGTLSVCPSRPYFVCVGTIERRKNHAMLLRAWRLLIDRMGERGPHLVIVGQWGRDAGEVGQMLREDAVLRAHVQLISRCPDAELASWIAGAQALLMPTLAEGFGLPVAEALALGTPVIASDLPCFREIGRGIPTLLDPQNAADWERAIRTFDQPGMERSRQLAALSGYRPATWDDHLSSVECWLEALPLPPAVRQGTPASPVRRSSQRPLAGSLALGASSE
jgi:glycosyltransferase involved in cell wall biosynthesis